MGKLKPGDWAWIGLWCYVTIVDPALIRKGHDPMTARFGAGLQHRHARWPITVGWSLLTIHLFSVLFPERMRTVASKMDPFRYLGAIASV